VYAHPLSEVNVKKIIRFLIRLPFYLLLVNLVLRLVRRFHKFPAPAFLVQLIDNRWRNPAFLEGALFRHVIKPGQRVLEIGPGGGTFTLAVAERVGPQGSVAAVDIDRSLIARLRERALVEGVSNLEARVSSVYDLPFPNDSFDSAIMITVFGEIPQPERMLPELRRVIRPGGTLAISEMLPDPDYSRDITILKIVSHAGFQVIRKYGNAMYYTLVFEKQ
jgi:ubiquinone/menaquinone biosynthesis C-methylase UbiE